MPVQTVRYVRKPLFVEAVQVTEDNFKDVAIWCQGKTEVDSDMREFIAVRVTNPMTPRQMRAYANDWILYTQSGYKVYTPKAFKKSFEPVQEELPVAEREGISVGDRNLFESTEPAPAAEEA